jgi:phage terminase small subunit
MSNKPKKVNVSVNPETMELLTAMKEKLARELGFTPSYAQVIQHLVKQGNADIVSGIPNQGEPNE